MKIKLLTRKGCHLCEDAEMILRVMQKQMTFQLEFIDIDQHPELRKKYHNDVPVIMADNAVICMHYLDIEKLVRVLKESH